jgi:carbamoyltransferase
VASGRSAWAEFGPRALGARSLLANPARSETKWRVNAIKTREQFRPFAPALLDELGEGLINGYQLSPFMALTMPATEKGQALSPAAVHVDGSARYQSVTPSGDPFRRLLESFKRPTGLPGVLNTSLNGGWEPITLRPAEALAFYAASGLDALVLGPCVLRKVRR